MSLKFKFTLVLLSAASAALAQTTPPVSQAPEVTYNMGVVSQYRYRGIAQTKGDVALQGGVDYTNANGFYAGAWASTIKWIKEAGAGATPPVDTKGSVELDLYGGYRFEALGIAYDVGYLRYQYVGNTYANLTGANANTDEVYGSATVGVFTAKYSYAFSNLFGAANSKGSAYIDLSANFDLGDGYSLVPHVGHQKVSNASNASYTDVALTLNKDLGNGLSASMAGISSNARNNDAFIINGYNTAKNAVVIGVKYAF